MGRCVLVLGTHRSGTSLVAGIMHTIGCNMGTQLLGPSSANPKGHFEDLDFLRVNDVVVQDWRNPQPLRNRAHVYRRLIKKRATAPLWGIKDPRLCFTALQIVPELLAQDVDVRFVYTQTDPDDINKSLMKRNGMSFEEAAITTDRYLDALRTVFTKFHSIPTLPVQHEVLLKYPQAGVRRIQEFVTPFIQAVDFVGT